MTLPTSPAFFRNVGSLVAARGVMVGCQLVALPLLARFLSVEDFGLIALGAGVVILTNVLSDAGLGRSLIRALERDEAEWSSVFWFLVAVGLVLSAGVAASAPLVAEAFGEPRLAGVVTALALLPLFQSLAAVPNAELERRDRFGVIARVVVAASLVSLAVAVVLAALGAGVWALVAQQLVLGAARSAGIAAASAFRPRLRFSAAALRPHLRFGRDTILQSLVVTAQFQVPLLVFGHVFGTTGAALVSMSERLLRLARLGVAGPVSRVAYVRMGRAQEEPAAIGELYLATMRLMSVVLFPAMAVAAAASDAALALFLSEKWRAAAPVFACASLGVAIEAATATGSAVFLAADRTGLQVRVACERFAGMLAVLALALPYGLEAAVLSQGVWAALYLPRFWSLVGRCAPVTVADGARALGPAAAVALAAFAVHATLVAPAGLSDPAELAVAAGEIAVAVAVVSGATRVSIRRALRVLRQPLAPVLS